MRSPQYRPVFDTGQIASLVAILTTAVGLVWAGSGQVSTFTQQISRQTEQISALRTDINAINASAAERTRYYSPRIDAVERDNQVQNERLSNASASILELRRQGAEMMSILSAMREDIASIKASRYGPGSRRTELIPQAVPATSR